MQESPAPAGLFFAFLLSIEGRREIKSYVKAVFTEQ
jgi:hypothetical protein